MTPSTRTSRRPRIERAEWGVRALFFTYFAFVGIFSPYLNLYFAQAGMTVAQIGVLMSLPQVLRIIGPPFWGWLADHAFARGSILRFSAIGSLLLVAVFPWATGFGYWALMPYMVVLFFMTSAQTPINEAMAVHLADGDHGRYGRMRVWGSIGFIIAVTAMGPLLDLLGLASLPYWMMLGAAGVLWASFSAHDGGGAPAPRRVPAAGQARPKVRHRLREPAIAWFFVANSLMIFAHAALYVLFSLYLEQSGYSKTEIGLIFALSVVAEILLFRYQHVLFARFDLMALFAASLLTAALRFGAVGLLAPGIVLLVITQISHAVTFGLHHSATMGLLHRWFKPGEQARAQAIYIVSSYGLGGSLGGLVCSQLWVRFHPGAAFLGAAAAALLGTIAALLSWRAWRQVERRREQGHEA